MSLHDLVKVAGNSEAIKEKIVTGANVDEIDKLRRTPAHMASWSGNLEALQLLVRANANLSLKAMDGFTSLHFAAQSASAEAPGCIRFLVKKSKGLLNQRITKGNKSALHLAASKGNVPNVTTLLELGADISAKTTAGQTAADLAKTPEVKTLLTSYSTQKFGENRECVDSDDESEAFGGNALEGATEVNTHGSNQVDLEEKQEGAPLTDNQASSDVYNGVNGITNTGSRKRPIGDVVTDE